MSWFLRALCAGSGSRSGCNALTNFRKTSRSDWLTSFAACSRLPRAASPPSRRLARRPPLRLAQRQAHYLEFGRDALVIALPIGLPPPQLFALTLDGRHQLPKALLRLARGFAPCQNF